MIPKKKGDFYQFNYNFFSETDCPEFEQTTLSQNIASFDTYSSSLTFEFASESSMDNVEVFFGNSLRNYTFLPKTLDIVKT